MPHTLPKRITLTIGRLAPWAEALRYCVFSFLVAIEMDQPAPKLNAKLTVDYHMLRSATAPSPILPGQRAVDKHVNNQSATWSANTVVQLQRLIKVDSHYNSEYNPEIPLQIYHRWIDHSEILGDNSQAYNIRGRDNAQSLLDKLVNTEHNHQYMQMNNVWRTLKEHYWNPSVLCYRAIPDSTTTSK